MLPKDLEERLMEIDNSRNKRQEIASWIVKKPHYVRETLQWAFFPESELLVETAWVLEVICQRKRLLFSKYMYLFFKQLPHIKNDSALRSCANICKILCYNHYRVNVLFGKTLNKEEKIIMTECCFDWLITDQKVACQASAMDALYYLGEDKMGEWIYPELKIILTRDAPLKSAGYQARARSILKKIS